MKVLNKHKVGVPPNAVYIGRGSPWGNPFKIGRDGDRAEVIAKYREWLLHNDLALRVIELKGKDLVCYCAPQACHGEVLIEFVDLLYGQDNLHGCGQHRPLI